ncbi:MAG: hypothetical protein ACK52J_03240 [bacterium]
MKDDFKLPPGQAEILYNLTFFAWTSNFLIIVKPCWGFISDSYPILGYRIKSYLVIFYSLQVLLI